MRLGRQERFVLAYCSGQDEGAGFWELIGSYRGWRGDGREENDVSAPARKSAQASMSRTLRALWRKGLVDLWGDHGWSATQMLEAARHTLAEAEKNPLAYYEPTMPEIIQLMRDIVDLQGLRTSTGLRFVPTPDKTVDEMLAPFREEVERLEKNPDLRVERVVLTDEGARVAQELPGWRMLVKG